MASPIYLQVLSVLLPNTVTLLAHTRGVILINCAEISAAWKRGRGRLSRAPFHITAGHLLATGQCVNLRRRRVVGGWKVLFGSSNCNWFNNAWRNNWTSSFLQEEERGWGEEENIVLSCSMKFLRCPAIKENKDLSMFNVLIYLAR